MNTNPIEIVFIATGDYAPFVATTALSIIENTNEQIAFHVLTENFKTEDKNTIRDFFVSYQNASFEFMDVTEKLKIVEGAQLGWFKDEKPWNVDSCFKAEIFWEYAKKTPYYEQLQCILKENMAKKLLYKQKLQDFATKIRSHI